MAAPASHSDDVSLSGKSASDHKIRRYQKKLLCLSSQQHSERERESRPHSARLQVVQSHGVLGGCVAGQALESIRFSKDLRDGTLKPESMLHLSHNMYCVHALHILRSMLFVTILAYVCIYVYGYFTYVSVRPNSGKVCFAYNISHHVYRIHTLNTNSYTFSTNHYKLYIYIYDHMLHTDLYVIYISY